MKLLLTENQVQNLIKILNEDEAPSYMKDIPIPPQLDKLMNAMGGNMDGLLSKLGPQGLESLKKFFGADDLSNLTTSTNVTLSNPLGNTTAKIGSGFSDSRGNRQHQGVDIPVKSGTPVYAPADGIVITAKDTTPNPCGGFIQINHGSLITKFCHLSKWVVSNGQQVKKGQVIGYTGGGLNDPYHGVSTGPHLHYQILDNKGLALNPQQSQFGLA